METAANGTFKGGYYIAGFEDGGTCSLGVFGDFFDADKQAKVNDVINKIKNSYRTYDYKAFSKSCL